MTAVHLWSSKQLNIPYIAHGRIPADPATSHQPLILVKKDTKGTFHAKMGLIKDRNGRDLTEAEDIKKRWQEYTGELYKKDLHDQDNHDGVITNLEPHPGM